MPDAPLVCSVVLTWNNYEDTAECVRSLLAQDHPNHRIFIVDNGSTDDSLARLMRRWPSEVSYVKSPANVGCGAGYALGLREALARGACFAAIIDNDVVAEPDLISSLLAPFARSGRVGLVSPWITFYEDPEKLWFAGGSYNDFLGYTRHTHLGECLTGLRPLAGRTYAADYAPTCAVLFSRTALEDVGLPDERLFFGHDDVDWCLRAREKGYLRLVVGRPLARHKVSLTGGEKGSTTLTSFSAYHHARGSMLIGAKHARGLRLLPYLTGQVVVRFPYYSTAMLKAGRLTGPLAYLRGLAAGVRYLGSEAT
jgi:GT2 family glycosyltransferase